MNSGLNIGIDIHGVLDKDPKKYITLANSLRSLFNLTGIRHNVYIITGPKKEEALKELEVISLKHNDGKAFWDDVYSIVDYILENNIPHTVNPFGFVWTNREEDWNMIKGQLSKELKLDFHFDDSIEYGKYFNPGVFFFNNSREWGKC